MVHRDAKAQSVSLYALVNNKNFESLCLCVQYKKANDYEKDIYQSGNGNR